MKNNAMNEVARSKTSSDGSNLMRGTVRTPNDEEIGEETIKQNVRCLSLCNFDDRDI